MDSAVNPKPAGQVALNQQEFAFERVAVVDYLIFIGSNFYPTPQDFIDEAARLGISRRMPSHQVPVGLVTGKSRVFLAHSGTKGGDSASPVFGYFVPSRIEYIVPPGTAEFQADLLAELELRPDTKAVGSVAGEGQRGCGYRKAGGTYIVVDKAESPLVLTPKGAGYVGRHFRGMKALTAEESQAFTAGNPIGGLFETFCDGCKTSMKCARDGYERQLREHRRFAKTGEVKWRNLCSKCKSDTRKAAAKPQGE